MSVLFRRCSSATAVPVGSYRSKLSRTCRTSCPTRTPATSCRTASCSQDQRARTLPCPQRATASEDRSRLRAGRYRVRRPRSPADTVPGRSRPTTPIHPGGSLTTHPRKTLFEQPFSRLGGRTSCGDPVGFTAVDRRWAARDTFRGKLYQRPDEPAASPLPAAARRKLEPVAASNGSSMPVTL